MTKTTGAYAASNPFRFSSEYCDEETGLVYYNYRYYNPELGRWISRAPIEEQGGYNLYGMIGNNPLYGWDDLGYGHAWWCYKKYTDAISDFWDENSEIIQAYGEGFLEGLSDGAAGVGDGLTTIPFTDFSLTEAARNALGINNINNQDYYDCSNSLGLIARDAIITAVSLKQSPTTSSTNNTGAQGCFLAGTLVWTPEGIKEIENLKIGDVVLAMPDSTQNIHDIKPCKITYTFRGWVNGYYVLEFSDGSVLKATAKHPFWIYSKGWLLVEDLQCGMKVITKNGEKLFLKQVSFVKTPTVIYNITVDKYSTYFVGDSGIYVHNKAMKAGSRPRNNQAQNKQFRDAVRDAGGLTKEQQQRLHREIGKENWGYHEIRQRVIEIKKGM